MCDRDHFAESVAEYEARGLVTRRQFGVLLAAGAAMALPQLANAQATGEREVEITTPDGTCDAYFVHPASGHGRGRADLARYFRPASGDAHHGQAARRGRVCRARGQPVLSGWQTDGHWRDPDQRDDGVPQGHEPGDRHDGCQDVRGLARRAATGEQEPQGRRAGLLHGRPDVVPHGRRDARPHRRGRVVPRRRARQRHRRREQSASAGGRHEGVVPDCHRRE